MFKIVLYGSEIRVNDQGIPNSIAVKVDVTKPEEVEAAFQKTESKFGSPVNVVVYNGMHL